MRIEGRPRAELVHALGHLSLSAELVHLDLAGDLFRPLSLARSSAELAHGIEKKLVIVMIIIVIAIIIVGAPQRGKDASRDARRYHLRRSARRHHLRRSALCGEEEGMDEALSSSCRASFALEARSAQKKW